MPHANSTTSSPRVTSPSASDRTLPCSAVISAATSSLRALSSSRNANSACARRVSEELRHSANASLAAATASSTTAAVAKSTWPVRSPVAGSNTSPWRNATPP